MWLVQRLRRMHFALVSLASAACMLALVLRCAHTAHAHELNMAEMEVRQLSPELLVWHWSAAGLPDNHLAVALLSFNVGVEMGQLLVVALAFLLWQARTRWPRLKPARAPALYVIGGVAAYWSLGRVVALVA